MINLFLWSPLLFEHTGQRLRLQKSQSPWQKIPVRRTKVLMFPSLPRKRTLERSVVALYATVSFEVQCCTAVRIWYFALALSEIVILYYLTLSYFNYSPAHCGAIVLLSVL